MEKRPKFVNNGLVNVPNIEIEYRGFIIKPKLDFGKYPYQGVNTYRKGYVMTKDGYNVMAGATWATSIVEAKSMIDSHLEAEGDPIRFWKIENAKRGLNEYEEV